MNAEQLSVFCEPINSKMCKPFSYGEYTYVTNGKLILRLPRMADVPEWDAVNESAEKLFSQIDIPAELIEIPEFRSTLETCKLCNGTGRQSECPECRGDCEVELNSGHHTYRWECKTCDGFGEVSGDGKICSECDGTKTEIDLQPVSVGCAHFAVHYLTLIKTLPGIRIGITDKDSAAYLKFDDGDGLLMPRKV